MKTAICILAYNRPAYFFRCLSNLLSNPEASSWPIHVFLDGPQQEAQRLQVAAVEEHCPETTTVHQYEENVGCGLNAFHARRILFEELGYVRVFVIEDDFLITPEYLSLVSSLLDYCEENYTDVGVAQCYWPCRHSYDWKEEHLRDITVGNPHWWGYLMPATTWDKIRVNLTEYVARFLLSRPYGYRDEPAIRAWALDKLSQWDGEYLGPRPFPSAWSDAFSYWRRTKHPLPASGQDAMTALSLQLAGLKKVSTIVNRGVSIGERGIHTSPDTWKARKMDSFELISFEGDSSLSSFQEV